MSSNNNNEELPGPSPLQKAVSAVSVLRESASGTLVKAASAANVLRESASDSLSKAAVSVRQTVPFIKTESNVSASSIKTQESDISQSQLDDYDISELCPKLTYKQRVMGFFSCFGSGYVITFFSFGFFIRLVEGNPIPFVTIYTTGNLLSLMASTFLCGPRMQFRRMSHETRKYTTIVYLSSIATTIIFAFIPGIPKVPRLIGFVLLLIIQFCSCLWYSLSYLPFARRAVLKFVKDNLGEGIV